MKLLDQIEQGKTQFTDQEIISLLQIDTADSTFYKLLALSNERSRKQFGKKGYVFAQIGINAAPCPKNCMFCSMGGNHYALDSVWEKTPEDIAFELSNLQKQYFDDFFLMTTADYSQQKFIETGKHVKPLLKKNQRMVANIGDFDLKIALQLKEAGFTGVYHINRLREGIDTLINPSKREQTIQATIDAGLELYYCIEPIGPEHSYEELTVEIRRACNLKVNVMAVMRRIAVQGTPLYAKGQITASELTKIVAVANLVVRPERAMNVHEPTQMALLAGVNQLYAESGANPRDTDSNTENSRGFTPDAAWKMLHEANYEKPQDCL